MMLSTNLSSLVHGHDVMWPGLKPGVDANFGEVLLHSHSTLEHLALVPEFVTSGSEDKEGIEC